jgi:MerR family Zn(II)-responsive transcriptional regulator of zntA
MRVGTLAAKSETSIDTIRYYEKLGLLGPIEKVTAYKNYPPRALRRLELIKIAKNIGFTLAEIGLVMDAWDVGELNTAIKKQLLTQKLLQVEAKFNDLAKLKTALKEILDKVESDCDDDA